MTEAQTTDLDPQKAPVPTDVPIKLTTIIIRGLRDLLPQHQMVGRKETLEEEEVSVDEVK